MHGQGLFNWWGFSPSIDLLNYVEDEDGAGTTVNVMVIGAGDPRHLLMTLARRRHRRRLRVYLLEEQVEVYARVLLLMGISLQQDLGLRERVSLLLDLWGNLFLRPVSRDYLEHAARRLSVAVTDPAQYPSLLGLISAGKLKYRERDAIDAICRTWYKLSQDQYDPALCWDVRLRQMLGTRYDCRQADAEWAWYMRLAYRIQKLHVGPPGREADGGAAADGGGERGDGYVGVGAGWGQEYLVWRGTGQAFTVATDATSHLPNTSLASVATIREGATRHRRVGYWGDILTGPFPALALASADARVSKTSNGRSNYSGSDVAQWNLEDLLHQLWAHHLEEEQQLDEGKVERLVVEGKTEKNEDKQVEVKVVKVQEGQEEKHLVESKAGKEREEKVDMHVEDKVEKQVKVMTEEKMEKQMEGNMEKQMEDKVKKKLGIHGEQQVTQAEAKTGKQEVTVKQKVNRERGKEDNNVVQTWGTSAETKGIPETEREQEKKVTKTKSEKDINKGRKFINNDKSDDVNNYKNKNYELLTNMNTDCEGGTTQPVSTVFHGSEKQSNTSSQRPGIRREVGDTGPSGDWLRLDGVEVILVSPSRLNDLTSLPEVEDGLDLLYLSAATAHLLTPTLLQAHLRPHTRLILETAQMFPELTDDQMREYETRVTSSAGEAGWERAGSHPLCHLLFYRK